MCAVYGIPFSITLPSEFIPQAIIKGLRVIFFWPLTCHDEVVEGEAASDDGT